MSSEPFISTDLFLLYSNIILDKPYNVSKIAWTIHSKEKPIIFIEIYFLNYYLPLLLKVKRPFVIVTISNDDMCVPYYSYKDHVKEHLHHRLLAQPYLLRWFTKNPCIIHPKLSPVPLGPKWQYTSNHYFGEDKAPTLAILHRHCMTPFENFHSKKPSLLYFHFSQTTFEPFYRPHQKMREHVLEICQTRFPLSTPTDFENYIIDLRQHRFCLCPPGRGLDTHRTWESLMVGTIPIVIRSPLDSLYDQLPVLIIDDWEILTPEYLEEQYAEMRTRTYDFASLYAPYWKKRLNEVYTAGN